MDMFNLLARGALIDRHGKDSETLEIVSGKKASTNVALENKKRADVSRRVDFFHENVSEEKEADDKKKKGVKRKNHDDDDDDDESESEDEEEEEDDIPLVISTKDQAAAQRNRLDTKVKGDDIPLPIGSFKDIKQRFNLHAHLLRNLARQNFTTPTPIQSEAIPIMLHGRDIVACAPTGSGKTLAFGIPVVQALKQHENKGIRCLVITPTKELATQIYAEFVKLSRGRDLNICVLNKSQAAKFSKAAAGSAGLPSSSSASSSKTAHSGNMRKYDILISTPLRLLSLTNSGKLDLSHVEHMVLDEVDKLFEQGFIQQTDSIIEQCTSPKLQKALFSATIPSGVEEIANNIMVSPVRVIIGKKEGASTTIEQKVVYAGNEHGKLVALRTMLQQGELEPPAIIFVQSIQRAKALYHELIYDRVNVDVIHGERTQIQRDKVIERFKNGDIWVLICTDVLARGIDFRGVNLVINYDVPESAQAYVHRIGRTGRAGRTGKAVTLYTKEDHVAIKAVVNVMKQSGCEVPDWMLSMRNATNDEKKKLKTKPITRDEISTVPNIVKRKRKERIEKEKEEKVKKSEWKKQKKNMAKERGNNGNKKKDGNGKKSILDESSDEE